MFNDSITSVRSNEGKGIGDYYNHGTDLDQKFILHWSPQEDNKFLFKHRYVASARSVPRRNRRFVQYRISRSLNFDSNAPNSSSDNSSLEGDKHLSRSAKIMRALNISSPTYYGKTKIKRSLNFNSTPSPKRFTRTAKSIQKTLSLNSSISPPPLNKILNYDESPTDSANSSLIFTSPESMDENQNETPSRQSFKAHASLSYSTPNTKFSKKSPVSTTFSPLLRSGLKKKVDNLIYLDTPNPQSLKCSKSRLKYADDVVMSTPRNLLRDFREDDDDRPCTPENIICIVPESMSAIKRSHKKERSRRSERSTTNSMNTLTTDTKPFSVEAIESPLTTPQMRRKHPISVQDPNSLNRCSKKSKSLKGTPRYNSDDDLSDTGSIFDYTEERKNVLENSDEIFEEAAKHDDPHGYQECKVEVKKQEPEDELKVVDNVEKSISIEVDSNATGQCSKAEVDSDENDAKHDNRPKTPEINVLAGPSNSVVTPENRINYLQRVMKDSIKKSHRKLKDDNKKRLFSPQVLHHKLEPATPARAEYNVHHKDHHEDITEIKPLIQSDVLLPPATNRAVTPEKVNSSRLLLSQFSSVKKSHKKDKHNKILSGFKKRQEYFNRDIEILKDYKTKVSDFDRSAQKNPQNVTLDSNSDGSAKNEQLEKQFPLNTSKEISDDSIILDLCVNEDTSLDKLSPSKRKSPLDVLSDRDSFNASCESELQDCDSPKEEFKIFTPLKRRRSLTTPLTKGYLCVYQVPSGKDDITEETDANLSRCLTPVASFRREHINSSINDSSLPIQDSNTSIESIENNVPEIIVQDSSPKAVTGRATPKDMSTTELYANIDSIKKSHKKNKRGYGFRKGLMSGMGNVSIEARENEMFSRNRDISRMQSSDDSVDDMSLAIDLNKQQNANGEMNCSIDSDQPKVVPSRDEANYLDRSSTSAAETTSSVKTPPNCLKTKSYIRLLQTTSIKRSHKKVRDRKKQEVTTDVQDLSDDGSIFGDEERIASTDVGEVSHSNNHTVSTKL